ncbi:MAG: DUF4199 domain-containing protein [Saprospiraceae bacterium]
MNNNLSIKWGILAGIGTIALLMCFYSFNKALIFNTWVYFGSLLVTVFIMWQVGNKLLLNTDINFSNLLKQLFLIFVLSELIYYVWYYTMVNYIDTTLLDFQKQQMLIAYEALKAKATDIQEVQQWSNMIHELETKGLAEVNLSSVLLQMGRGIIGGFVLSYLLTFILQRRR